MNTQGTVVSKKPYQTPVVQVYGSVQALTKALGATGKNDGGQSPPQKTGLP